MFYCHPTKEIQVNDEEFCPFFKILFSLRMFYIEIQIHNFTLSLHARLNIREYYWQNIFLVRAVIYVRNIILISEKINLLAS